MNDSNADRDPFEILAESFLTRLRRGEYPTVEEYAAKHPELADEICELLPALVALEQDMVIAGAVSGISNGLVPTSVPAPQQLGDYTILREIGRGGMGVVYEAVQESLGRHVALKVLPKYFMAQPGYLLRFHREAKSAARLHHTNIVSVFGVGQDKGYHFYAMQYIHGETLENVIKEIKSVCNKQDRAASGESLPQRSPPVASDITLKLVSDGLDGSQQQGPTTAERSASETTIESDRERVCDHGIVQQRSAVSCELIDSRLDRSKASYYHALARIGKQLSEAMSYAHVHGVFHRDIKPSNLLIDVEGNVWVADFGLAKLDDDGSSQHGDALGTLPYMAPECIDGVSDARSDIYAIGVTLYEVLALQRPFKATEKTILIGEIRRGEARPLSQIDQCIPRDLEAVVLKAMALKPGDRYETARLLAADLLAFEEDRPVRARPLGIVERGQKWCRRHRLAARFAAGLLVAVSALLAGGIYSYVTIRADRAKAVDQTYRARLSETQTLRLSRPEGWFDTSLGNIGELTRLDTPLRDPTELRGEVVACLLEFGTREGSRLGDHKGPVWSVDFSPDGSILATADHGGSIRLWDVASGRLLRHVVDSTARSLPPFHEGSPKPTVRFHPDGKYLAYTTWDHGVRLLNLGPDPSTRPDIRSDAPPRDLAFDSAGGLIAVAWGSGRVGVHEAATGVRKCEVATNDRNGDSPPEVPDQPIKFVFPCRLSPDGTRLATRGCWPEDVRIHSMKGSESPLLLRANHGHGISLCFSPDGLTLATGGSDDIFLWDIRSGHQALTLDGGHLDDVQDIAFSASGDLLASVGVDQTARVWNPRTGQQLLVVRPRIGPLFSVAFSPDSLRLAVGGVNAAVIYPLSGRSVRQNLPRRGLTSFGLAFHPLEPILASGTDRGLVVLDDIVRSREVGRWRAYVDNPAYRLAFDPNGESIATGSSTMPERRIESLAGREEMVESQIVIWDAKTGENRHRFVGHRGDITSLGFSPSGRRFAASTADGTVSVWEVDSGELQRRWRCGEGFWVVGPSVAFETDEQVVLADHGGLIRIIDIKSDSEVRHVLVEGGVARMVMAPDRRHVVLTHYDGMIQVLSLPGLETAAEPDRQHLTVIASLAFSGDGRLLATGSLDGKVVLWETATWRKLYTFPKQDQESQVNDIVFQPGGLRLAIADNRGAVTVWDISEIQPTLAKVGLDWKTAAMEAVPINGRGAKKGSVRSRGLGPIWRILRPWMAMRFAERCIRVNPGQAQMINELAWLLLTGPDEVRNPKKALALAEQATALASDAPLVWNTLAAAYFRLERYDDSLRALDHAAKAYEALDQATKADLRCLEAYNAFFRAMDLQQKGDAKGARVFSGRAVSFIQKDIPDPIRAEPREQIYAEELQRLQIECDTLLRSFKQP